MIKTTKPSKQRKRLYQANVNVRYKQFSAPLSSKLKESHGTNSLPVRKGDTVMVMRGDRKGSEGKVTQIDRKKYRIFIDGATREKVDGTTISMDYIHYQENMLNLVSKAYEDGWNDAIKFVSRNGGEE